MYRFLPPVPDIAEYRNEAKGLLDAGVALDDARDAIAREHGFKGWSRFVQHVETVAGSRPYRAFERNPQYYADRAAGLLSVLATGQERALSLVRTFHPRFADASLGEIRRAQLNIDDARLVHAREHGFDRWEDLERHVSALIAGQVEEPFTRAFEAIRDDDLTSFSAALASHPDLPNARGTNGNSLLSLAVYFDRLEMAQALLDAGADADLPNDKGWTALHQAAYSDRPAHADLLLRAGGSVELMAHGDGGTPLVQALFWGHRHMADKLAEVAVVPNNLRVAAGLGRLDLLESFFAAGGWHPDAGKHREFHRPHSGFPPWIPSNDPQEILDEAFVWACRNGRTGVLQFLLDRGADIDADPYRGTGLTWATHRGDVATVEWLLDHGADPNREATFGGPDHGVGITALHLAAQQGHLEVARLLLSRGADVNVIDQVHGSTPIGWAEYCHQPAVRDLLLEDELKIGLYNAVQFGCIARLGELGGDPNGAYGPGGPGVLLRMAAARGHVEVVEELLRRGADPNLPGSEGRTALDWARKQGHQEIARQLFRHGAVDEPERRA
jgi:ankyrin repeat protein